MASFFPTRGNPHSWEIKSKDFLTPNNWNRRKKRNFCLEIVNILKRNDCHVYAVSMDKVNATGALPEATYIPLAFQRLIAKFYDEVIANADTGIVVCDWSSYQMDHHITACVGSMIGSRGMDVLRGGITYGSSMALPPLQVADLIAGTFRRCLDGQSHLQSLEAALLPLRYSNRGVRDIYGHPVDSILRLF